MILLCKVITKNSNKTYNKNKIKNRQLVPYHCRISALDGNADLSSNSISMIALIRNRVSQACSVGEVRGTRAKPGVSNSLSHTTSIFDSYVHFMENKGYKISVLIKT